MMFKKLAIPRRIPSKLQIQNNPKDEPITTAKKTRKHSERAKIVNLEGAHAHEI